VQCSLVVYNKCIADNKLTDEQVQKLRNINDLMSYRDRLNLYFGKIHDDLISTDDTEGTTDDTKGLNCVNDIYKKYQDSYDFVYFFEQVFYTSAEINKNDTLKTNAYIPNILYPEHDKKVALGNLTMVKKSKFEIIKNLRYDVRIGAAFCLDKVKNNFSKEFSSLFEVDQNLKRLFLINIILYV
jgi:hypothetical protein